MRPDVLRGALRRLLRNAVRVAVPIALAAFTPQFLPLVGCGRLLSPLRPGGLPARTALVVHQLTHDADELGGLEGLGEKGVDTGTDPAGRLVLTAGTDDRHRQMSGPRVGPQPLGRLDPVQAGHDDVEGDDIRTDLMNDIQTLGTIGRGHDLEPLEFEIDPDQLPDHLVVVDNEHPTGHA
ncbi:hypothetical protein BN2537_5873 [Streptomyces venezuelae]|nr:hypothetical protein BN2537_5873 [Streptomyces venezuelae]